MIVAAAALVSARGQEQPSLAERAVNLALAGRCTEAIPLLKQASSESADKDAKRLTGKFGVRCAMLLNHQSEASSFLSRLQQEFPNDPDILFLAVHMYSDLAYRNSQQLMQVAPDSFTNGAKLPELKKTGPAFYNCLLRNEGNGAFKDVTRKAGLAGETLDYNFGIAVGDYDNDGYEDLFVCSAGRNALYHNNGNGTFTDVTRESGIGAKPAATLSVGAAWFDYDCDGLLDLVVANYTLWNPRGDPRCTSEGVEYYCDPRLYSPSVPPRLYHNLGHGKFEDVTEKSGFGRAPGKGMGISIADFNGDGWPDVFIANDTEANSLFINKGDGTFEDQAAIRRGLRR